MCGGFCPAPWVSRPRQAVYTLLSQTESPFFSLRALSQRLSTNRHIMGRLQRVVAHIGPRLARDLATRFTTVSLPHPPASAPDPPRPRPTASSELSSSQMLLSLSDILNAPSRQAPSPLTPLMAALMQAGPWPAQPGLATSTAPHTSSLDSLLSAVGQQQQQQQEPQPSLQQLAIALQSAQVLAAIQANRAAAPAQLHVTSQPLASNQPRLRALQQVMTLARQPVSGPMALSQTTGRDHSQGVRSGLFHCQVVLLLVIFFDAHATLCAPLSLFFFHSFSDSVSPSDPVSTPSVRPSVQSEPVAPTRAPSAPGHERGSTVESDLDDSGDSGPSDPAALQWGGRRLRSSTKRSRWPTEPPLSDSQQPPRSKRQAQHKT